MKLKFILIFKPVPGPETRAAAVHVRTFADGGCRKKRMSRLSAFGGEIAKISSFMFGQSIFIGNCPLVNVYKTMENHHFQWENPL